MFHDDCITTYELIVVYNTSFQINDKLQYITSISLYTSPIDYYLDLHYIESVPYQVHPIYGVRGAVRVNSNLPHLSHDR